MHPSYSCCCLAVQNAQCLCSAVKLRAALTHPSAHAGLGQQQLVLLHDRKRPARGTQSRHEHVLDSAHAIGQRLDSGPARGSRSRAGRGTAIQRDQAQCSAGRLGRPRALYPPVHHCCAEGHILVSHHDSFVCSRAPAQALGLGAELRHEDKRMRQHGLGHLCRRQAPDGTVRTRVPHMHAHTCCVLHPSGRS